MTSSLHLEIENTVQCGYSTL